MIWRRVKFVLHSYDTVQTVTKAKQLHHPSKQHHKQAALTMGNLLSSMVTGLVGVGARLGTKIHQFIAPKEMLTWHTADDELVFFPAYTLVKTNEGNKLISKIKMGDMILTRKDYHRCIAVSKRKYSDSMNTIQTNIGELTATYLD